MFKPRRGSYGGLFGYMGAALCLLALGLTGCGDSEAPMMLETTTTPVSSGYVCVPGQIEACACEGSEQGTRVCSGDGMAFTVCTCPAGGTPVVTGGVDTGPLVMMPGQDASTGSGTSGTSGGDATGGPGPADAGDTGGPASAPLAHDIRVSEIALYQAVKVPLVEGGEPVVARNAPVIVGKEGFLRVFVEPEPGFVGRELEAVLTLTSGGVPQILTATQRVSGPSSDASLESTLNFDIPSGTLVEDTQWSLVLNEKDASESGSVDPSVRFPAQLDEQQPMGARNAGPLRVVIVPYRYMPDGSQRLPNYDADQLELIRTYLYAFYPITEVEIELHDPVDYTSTVGPNTGWERFLDDHCALRTSESPDPKVLYYGLLSPKPDARSYGGGVYGISYLPGPAANYGRCSVGVGFAGDQAASVVAHELGHSLGLPHAPCGVSGGPYPYADASIGSWGFGLSSRTLKDPGTFKDMMSYCNPVFISDFNFQKLFERVRYLNLQFNRVDPDPTPRKYVRILELGDEPAEVVGRHTLAWPPGGEEEQRPVQLLDESGKSLGTREGYFLPRATGGGGVWFVPDVGQAAVNLGSGRVDL